MRGSTCTQSLSVPLRLGRSSSSPATSLAGVSMMDNYLLSGNRYLCLIALQNILSNHAKCKVIKQLQVYLLISTSKSVQRDFTTFKDTQNEQNNKPEDGPSGLGGQNMDGL